MGVIFQKGDLPLQLFGKPDVVVVQKRDIRRMARAHGGVAGRGRCS